jgi:hypothetical protein
MTPYDNLHTVSIRESCYRDSFDVDAGFSFASDHTFKALPAPQAKAAMNFLVSMMHKSVMAPTVIGELTAILAQEAKQ